MAPWSHPGRPKAPRPLPAVRAMSAMPAPAVRKGTSGESGRRTPLASLRDFQTPEIVLEKSLN